MNALSYISSNLITPIEEEELPSGSQSEDVQTYTNDVSDTCVSSQTQIISKVEDVLNEDNQRSTLVLVLLFFPKYLLVKPIFFLWFLITFPITLFEQKNKKLPKSSANLDTMSKSKNLNILVEEDLSGGGEIILQRDTLNGSLLKSRANQQHSHQSRHAKSSSSSVGLISKKIGRFLFPKKLIPRSILHSGRKKKLVLDLDETLIHSISRSTPNSNNAQAHLVEVKFPISGISTLYYVHKRPYCDLFLSKVCRWYDLIIFTASMKEYADPVIDWLETSFRGSFSKRFYRNDCILRDGVGYIKDLSIVNAIPGSHAASTTSHNNHNNNNNSNTNSNDNNDNNDTNAHTHQLQNNLLSEVILIDNSPVSYAMNVDNAIQVQGWISDPTDQDLLNLLPFLESLRNTTDVRNILSLKNGERAFNVNN
ncbi:hypothetical protein Kpol_348p8 [Vanderwaltozyma polyspora DSM 70294]|uniref:Mitochondrial import inner membrane translocase subunit TIM50 n=1 Tax=Vanderwaltozyma polyspora (strain ATCC 22028 / DSM 70294 / BCRC 21397 / CBS 2163 / NBRC 10782 / NRRL Y-8283 / UCD 57-17) TaxID=436907 RepID=A7TS54_VANPO|nr:uncharacterized protein Kpol_348p8 [Vanderwaltozyma polyspora DSM 70294]EDO14904.1 hypothetical protein Kpol_348p8 [Vanderwaltozyma polyspora DSM 70294]